MSGGGSYFKGWASNLPYIPSPQSSTTSQEIWIGHVLEVNYDFGQIGKIRVRLVGSSKELLDKDIKVEAYPADLNIIKYPLPGELVIITQGIRNEVANNKFAIVYYYMTTLSSNQNLTFNSDPYIGQTVPEKKASKVYTAEYEQRFEQVLKSKESFIDVATGALKGKAPLQPYEGDFILQGRFGAAIRLGSTDQNKGNEWSSFGKSPIGNPIMILSARVTDNQNPVMERVDEKNASSIYLCSTQTLPVSLATSRELKSHLVKYDLKSVSTNPADSTQFLESEVHPPTISFPVGTDASGSQLSTVINSGGKRSEIRQLIVHYTVGDGLAINTVNSLVTKGLGIHYCIQGDGVVARGDGGDDKIILWHGNDLNTWGVGIEIATYGRLKPANKEKTKFTNDYGSTHRNKWGRDVVNFGFTWNSGDYWSDYTDAQIASLKNIFLDTMNRYPKLKAAVVGKNLWQQVFGLDTDPVYGGNYKNKKLATNQDYGIFCHNRAKAGSHSDSFPSPRLVKMLKEIGMTGTYLAPKELIPGSSLK